MKRTYKMLAMLALSFSFTTAGAQETPKEEDFFKIMKVRVPEGTILEVGGLVTLPNGDLGISTRRGDVFIVENPTGSQPYFRKFATGLHEILGLAYKDGAFYVAQRGELTKLIDKNMDGKADVYETIYAWPLSGHYHEYSFGPKIAPDGSFFVTGNVAFGSQEWWRAESRVPMRGWAMNITEDGKMRPWAAGMRSPAGLNVIDGQLYYTENQGDWVGSGGIWKVNEGDFMGHPASLIWTKRNDSPLKLSSEFFYSKMDERRIKDDNGKYLKPENRVNENFKTLFDMKKVFPDLRLPAVWLPYGILGISTSEPVKIPKGNFGPFEGQLLIGDQGMSIISRVFMEKVNGEEQGAAFLFRAGFRSGVLRMAWDQDGSLFVGETNRGWGSAGDANEGLERLVYNNKIPFEMKAVRAMPDGFEIEFTSPVDLKSAQDIASYNVESFIYKYQPVYGSPPVNKETLKIKGVKVSADGLKARIVVNNLRQYYIHTIYVNGIREKQNFYSVVHPVAYYTLNNIPSGEKLAISELSTKNSANDPVASVAPAAKTKKGTADSKAKPETAAKKTVETKAVASAKTPTYNEVKGLLASYTCLACHNPVKKQVGPAFADVAKRNYSNEKILQLIHNPKPENWPGYATEMPPMPQVSKADGLKIAAYINSLK
ncbi:membrane protein [Pedobacter heparinus]|uniref:Cytochrome c class I n=1 Tax=Pedobacter heparinus (strain ATCC 13125 / DSM 2366 / CIP 104194 / JCM 7457 / NBRC 12017 / NCIMB 9290 / NRRL B-14731 / HIM 762-3) TaxID=485917 RepID=C6XXZ1_PEDHD|nr:membrane protein [Pedobacter heparinus]ACU04409.1 cytochrome c class I [Pedobacter heparinus DSM 2366]